MGTLTDWHTHCFLPEHRSADDQEMFRRKNVAGTGEPTRTCLQRVSTRPVSSSSC